MYSKEIAMLNNMQSLAESARRAGKSWACLRLSLQTSPILMRGQYSILKTGRAIPSWRFFTRWFVL